MSRSQDNRREQITRLASELVSRPSMTPDDSGCQEVIAHYLTELGFRTESLQFGEVRNLWSRLGDGAPLFAFAGHTDVVPPGDPDQWTVPPFEGRIEGDWLHGRGAADMKGSLAAMLVAVQSFLDNHPARKGSLAFLITSDEEGPARDGTARVVELLSSREEFIDYCIVGEPSSLRRVGDMVKVGRRGSLTGAIRIIGKQGHVAYPDQAVNPVPAAAHLISMLVDTHWDDGNDRFPPTSFQISNIHAGTGAGNVIPGQVEILCNFRFSPESTPRSLQERVEACCKSLNLDYTIDWTLFGMPFQTPHGALLDAVRQSISTSTGIETECSTSGGTSDGRFIAPTGAQVVELGPVNETIHRVNERVSIDDLVELSIMYERTLEHLLTWQPVGPGRS